MPGGLSSLPNRLRSGSRSSSRVLGKVLVCEVHELSGRIIVLLAWQRLSLGEPPALSIAVRVDGPEHQRLFQRRRAHSLVQIRNLLSVPETHSERHVFSVVHGSIPEVYPRSGTT